MQDWKAILNKSPITTTDEKFYEWYESIMVKYLTDKFYYKHEDWLYENLGLCSKWLESLYKKQKSAKDAAKIIEKAFNILCHD